MQERVNAAMSARDREESRGQKAQVPITYKPLPAAPVCSSALTAPPSALTASPSLADDLMLFKREFSEMLVNSHREHTSRTQELGTLLQSFMRGAESRFESMQQQMDTRATQMESRLDARMEQLEQRVGTVTTHRLDAVNGVYETRMLLEFLVKFGMDTRTGLICAFPVHLNSTLRIAICVPLLKLAFMALFPKKAASRKMTAVTKYFNFLYGALQQHLVEVELEEVEEVLMAVFPMRLYNNGKAAVKDWIVMDVGFFIANARHVTSSSTPTLASRPEVAPLQVVWKEGKGRSAPMWDASSRRSPSEVLKGKVAWGREVVHEVVNSPAVLAYFAELGGPSTPTHFCGTTFVPSHPLQRYTDVTGHGSASESASASATGKGGARAKAPPAKRARRHSPVSSSSSSSSDGESSADGSGDEEGDEIVR